MDPPGSLAGSTSRQKSRTSGWMDGRWQVGPSTGRHDPSIHSFHHLLGGLWAILNGPEIKRFYLQGVRYSSYGNGQLRSTDRPACLVAPSLAGSVPLPSREKSSEGATDRADAAQSRAASIWVQLDKVVHVPS